MSASTISVLSERVRFAFSGKTAPNRFLKAAMTERLCTYSESNELARGEPTQELEKAYEVWSSGCLGVFHTGNIMVHHAHLEAKGCAILDHEISKSYLPAFARLQRAATSRSPLPPVIIGQLAYLGGTATIHTERHPLIAAEAESHSSNTVSAANWTHESFSRVARRFAFAASVLKDAGFDGVQIHCAYGNIITHLLSRQANTRTDEYGGSLENRARFLMEIISAVKESVNNTPFVVGVKLNSTDFINGGLPAPEPQELARLLENAQVDYIEVSGGTLEDFVQERRQECRRYDTSLRQEHFLRFVGLIRTSLTKTKLAVTGGFKTSEGMANAIVSGATDFVGLARSLAHEPTLAAEILEGRASGAKSNRLPASLTINLEAGISQIQRMGKGLPLRDFSDDQVTSEWLAERRSQLLQSAYVPHPRAHS